ncbi:MAG TPA: DUF2997 domain-containing protein [Dactylosporangium sp.]|jgi:hypothetical protein|nr:DUF2997 domain-containing protein [Dactylosporangium sp.]
MKRIVVTVAADGTVNAETLGITGSKCLDYVALLEDLLAAQAVHSRYTADYAAAENRVAGRSRQEQRDEA